MRAADCSTNTKISIHFIFNVYFPSDTAIVLSKTPTPEGHHRIHRKHTLFLTIRSQTNVLFMHNDLFSGKFTS